MRFGLNHCVPYVLERPLFSEPLASFIPCVLAHYDLLGFVRIISPRHSVAAGSGDSSRRPRKVALSEETVAREILSGLYLRH